MRAIVYTEPAQFELTEIPVPVPGPGQVLLKVLMTGVCGTDLHLHVGEFSPSYPLTPGHEMVGEIAELGAGVTGFRVGQRVTVDNARGCGTCADCRRGMAVACGQSQAQGVNAQGGFAEYVCAEAGQCYPAEDLTVEEAVFAEPLSCVVHGIDAIGMRPGANALVFGAGPTGLLLAQLLRATGAASVTVAAPTQFKLDIAQRLGLQTKLVDRATPDATVEELCQHAPQRYDVVADATGQVSVLGQAMRLVRDGGTIVVYGVADESARWEVSPYEIFRREIRIQGSFAQSNEFDRTMRWLRSDAIRTADMITHRFSLAEYGDALEAAGSSDCLKAVVVP